MRQRQYLKILMYVVIQTILYLFLITSLTYWLKIKPIKYEDILKIIDSDKLWRTVNFEDFTKGLSELLGIVLLIFLFSFINYVASSIGNENLEYTYKRIKKICSEKFKFKNIIILIFIIIYIVLVFLSSQFPDVELLLKIYFIFTGVILIVKFGRLIFKKISGKTIISNKNSNKSNLLDILLFVISILFSIYLLIRSAPSNYIEFESVSFFFVHNVTIYFIFILLKNVLKFSLDFLFLEYNTAKIEKEVAHNYFIIDTLLNEINDADVQEKKRIKKIFHEENKKSKYKLKKSTDFHKLVDQTSFKLKIKRRIKNKYMHMVIDHDVSSDIQAEVVKKRNVKNLFLSIFIAFTFTILIFFLEKHEFFLNKKIFLEIMFIVVLFKLLIRSLEIGVSFYKDIKPDSGIKNTNLSNNERMGLVLKSLLEIIILSGFLYFIIDNLMSFDKNKTNLKQIFDSYAHALATSFFNTSLPYDRFNDFKINEKTHSYKISTESKNFSWLNFIQFIHFIQLVTSIILISLSITSYGSKNSKKSSYILRKSKNKYQILLFVSSNHRFNKMICESNTIENLNLKIMELIKKNELNTADYLEIEELIKTSTPEK